MSRHTVEYFGIPIEYELIRKQVKNLNIRINESGVISVSANKAVTVDKINEFVESHAEWIIRNLADLERYNSVKPDNDIYTGKRLYILGNAFTAEIIESREKKVVAKGDKIFFYTDLTDDEDDLKAMYKKFLTAKAQSEFERLLKKVYESVDRDKIPYPQMTVRNMKTRWGSCKAFSNTITLNLQLIKADEECIEQVIVHELMHFIEPNHSKKFYDCVEKYMPDWKARKQRLEEKYKDGIF